MRKKLSLLCALIALNFSNDVFSGTKRIVNHFISTVTMTLTDDVGNKIRVSVDPDQVKEQTYTGGKLLQVAWSYDGKTGQYAQPDLNTMDTIVIQKDGTVKMVQTSLVKYVINVSSSKVDIRFIPELAKLATIPFSIDPGKSVTQPHIGNLLGITWNNIPYNQADLNTNDTIVINADGKSIKVINTGGGITSGVFYIINLLDSSDSAYPIKLSSNIEGELSLNIGSWQDGKLSYWNNQKKDGLQRLTYKYKGKDTTYAGADLNTKDTAVIASDGSVKLVQTGGIKRNIKYIANLSSKDVAVTLNSDLLPPITVSIGAGKVVAQLYWNNLKDLTYSGKTYKETDLNTKDTALIQEDGTIKMYQIGSQPKIGVKYLFNFTNADVPSATLESDVMGSVTIPKIGARRRSDPKYYIGNLKSITFKAQTSDAAINTNDTAVLSRDGKTIKLSNTGGEYSQRTINNTQGAIKIDWTIKILFDNSLDMVFTIGASDIISIDFPGKLTGFKHLKKDKDGKWQETDYSKYATPCTKTIYIQGAAVSDKNKVSCI